MKRNDFWLIDVTQVKDFFGLLQLLPQENILILNELVHIEPDTVGTTQKHDGITICISKDYYLDEEYSSLNLNEGEQLLAEAGPTHPKVELVYRYNDRAHCYELQFELIAPPTAVAHTYTPHYAKQLIQEEITNRVKEAIKDAP